VSAAGDTTKPEPERLRLLFCLVHGGYMRVYAPVVQLLAERGHAVHVAFSGIDRQKSGVALAEKLSRRYPGVTYGVAPARGRFDGWRSVAWLVRGLGDLARYAHPRYAQAQALRDRMGSKVESHLRFSSGFDPATRRLALRLAGRLRSRIDADRSERAVRRAAKLEQAVPTSRRVTRFVKAHSPDAVLVSPLVDLASSQLEYLKAARRLGIPTAICVASWDNLTGKGLLRFAPERVLVWNETQRREAVEMHGIPAGSVVATGAPRFDEWFARRPGTSPEEFKRKLGIDPGRPYLLYLCSSSFVSPDEVGFVSRWVEAIRAAGDPELREIGIVVRPYPKHAAQWRGVDAARFGNASIWPRKGAEPDAGEARADFFDSLAHSAAVVGANTSAMIEAAIVGKSVYTVLAPEFAQEGTIHFHYLVHENGGFLHVASSLDEHLAQLRRGLPDADDAGETRRFIESFVRPNGIDRAATPIFCDEVEGLARLSAAPATSGLGTVALRMALLPLACACGLAAAGARAKAALRNRLPGGRPAGVPKSRTALRTPAT
jgi:hypothetical protein